MLGRQKHVLSQSPTPFSRALLQNAKFMCCRFGVPKGPSRTKNTMESKFSTGTNFGTAITKRYGECSEMLFSKTKRQENGTDSEKLRRWQNTYGYGRVLWVSPRPEFCREMSVPQFKRGQTCTFQTCTLFFAMCKLGAL